MGATERRDKISGVWNAQIVCLANITNIEPVFEAALLFPESFPSEKGFCLYSKPLRDLPCLPSSITRFLHCQQNGLGKILHYVRAENPQCREASRKYRQEHSKHFERLGKVAGMQTAGPSKRYQRVVPGIMTAFNGNQAQGPFDHGIGDTDDSVRKSFDVVEISFALF